MLLHSGHGNARRLGLTWSDLVAKFRNLDWQPLASRHCCCWVRISRGDPDDLPRTGHESLDEYQKWTTNCTPDRIWPMTRTYKNHQEWLVYASLRVWVQAHNFRDHSMRALSAPSLLRTAMPDRCLSSKLELLWASEATAAMTSVTRFQALRTQWDIIMMIYNGHGAFDNGDIVGYHGAPSGITNHDGNIMGFSTKWRRHRPILATQDPRTLSGSIFPDIKLNIWDKVYNT